MLANATSWDTVPARTSYLVTLASWALFLAVLADLALTASLLTSDDLFGAVFTGFGHGRVMLAFLLVLALGLLLLAGLTRGFRYANHRVLRCWTAALGGAALGLGPAILALVGAGLFFVLMVALCLLVLAIVFGMLA